MKDKLMPKIHNPPVMVTDINCPKCGAIPGRICMSCKGIAHKERWAIFNGLPIQMSSSQTAVTMVTFFKPKKPKQYIPAILKINKQRTTFSFACKNNSHSNCAALLCTCNCHRQNFR